MTTEIECRDPIDGIALEFGLLKKIMRSLVDELDERVLLPSESKFLKVVKNRDQFDVTFRGSSFAKFYSFPCEDVEILPVSNISSELLARYLCEQFGQKLAGRLKDDSGLELGSIVLSISVSIEETRGQSVKYRWEV